LNGDSDLPAITFTKLFVPRRGQCQHCLLQVLALDQDIIGIKRRNREDRNLRLCQRLHKRCQHTGHRKRKRPFELQPHPSALNGCGVTYSIFRAGVFRTDSFRTNNKAPRAYAPRRKIRPPAPTREGGHRNPTGTPPGAPVEHGISAGEAIKKGRVLYQLESCDQC